MSGADWDWQTAHWPLGQRHQRLPKWAQDEIRKLRLDEINREMDDCVKADVRELCKTATGMNCTFADDDIRLMAILASRAVDARLFDDVGDQRTRYLLAKAAARRSAAQAIDAPQPNQDTPTTQGERT